MHLAVTKAKSYVPDPLSRRMSMAVFPNMIFAPYMAHVRTDITTVHSSRMFQNSLKYLRFCLRILLMTWYRK